MNIIKKNIQQKNRRTRNDSKWRYINSRWMAIQYKCNILNKNIATIDFNGNIIEVSSGETTIECKSIDGKKIYATCNLIVEYILQRKMNYRI